MKKNNCKHPEAYVSKIGNYYLCNICGETFKELPFGPEVKVLSVSKEYVENPSVKAVKPKRRYTRRQKLDI